VTAVRRILPALATGALLLATLGAKAASSPPGATAKVLAPADVLANYARALKRNESPPAMSFDYSVAQLGLVNMEQTHHVYRSGLHERDEMLVVDGYTLKRPSIRILANRTARYDISAVAPPPAAYRFTYGGKVLRDDGYAYVFKTEALSPRAFSVTAVELDGVRFLPSFVRFKIGGTGARGSGELTFAPSGRYWVVRDATVSAHLTNGTTAHEHIVWSDYSFPSELPPSTFEAPSVRAPDAPEPAATTTPEPPPGP
jgi:hypothetical protein